MEAREAMELLREARAQGLAAIEAARDPDALRTAEVAALGRKAPISQVQRSLGKLNPGERPAVGQAVNRLFEELRAAFAARAPGRLPEEGPFPPVAYSAGTTSRKVPVLTSYTWPETVASGGIWLSERIRSTSSRTL